VRQWHVGHLGSAVRAMLHRVVFPRSGASLGYARKWLLAGTRISTLAVGICLAFGLYHHWYIWIPIGASMVFLVADVSLAYRARHGSHV